MTPAEMTDLARRAVEAKGWRWMPGMKDLDGWRLHRELPLGGWDAIGGEWEYHQLAHFPKLPDLTDPATVGCFLALVREAWGDPYAFVGAGPTEAEALVKALEAAP